MSTTKQIEHCTNRLASVDHEVAADFSTAMYEANRLATNAFRLRQAAWDLYREALRLPKPSASRAKGGER